MTEPQLPQRRTRRRRLVALIGAGVVVVVGIVVGVVVATGGSGDSGGGKTISIGVTDRSEPYWDTFAALAKKKLGVTVKFVNFTDYSQPNPALSQGQLDLNEFQHIQYLANYNVTAHKDLRPIGATAVYPLPLYSTKYHSVPEIPKGAKVAIPNDAVNEARGLLVLQSAGLLKLANGGTAFSSVSDVTSHQINVVPLDASQTAGALKSGSVSAAIVNNNYATSAKLAKSDVLFQDDPAGASSAPYVNVFVARAKDANNSTYLKLAALYHDATVEKGVQQANAGTAVFRTLTPAALQKELRTVQTQESASK